MKAKILVLGDYPITTPLHGGQKRTRALVDFYKSFLSSVKYIGVFHPDSYYEYSKNDVFVTQDEVLRHIKDDYQAIELILGNSPNIDAQVRDYLRRVLSEYRPDIIHIEQPYLYSGVKVLLKELGMKPLMIYGSQNIEYEMKRGILSALGYDRDKSRSIVKLTRNLEEEFSRDADIVVAVSQRDATAHREMGARNVVIGKNGIDKRARVSKKATAYWRAYKKQHGVDHLITFVGSGHPPNHKGFLQFLGSDSRFLPANALIVIAGAVAGYFDAAFKRDTSNHFWSGIETVGVLSDDDLTGLLEASDTIILPIGLGGGSNLKSAEAIYSKKKVVASRFAFRSFEDYVTLPNIFLADDEESFKKALIKAVETPPVDLAEWQKRKSDRVVWQYSLAPIRVKLKRLILRQRLYKSAKTAVRPLYRLLRKLGRQVNQLTLRGVDKR